MTMIDGAAHGGSLRLTSPIRPGSAPPRTGSPRTSSRRRGSSTRRSRSGSSTRVRPRSIVELGTHHGFSFFVFAEAVERLGLDARHPARSTPGRATTRRASTARTCTPRSGPSSSPTIPAGCTRCAAGSPTRVLRSATAPSISSTSMDDTATTTYERTSRSGSPSSATAASSSSTTSRSGRTASASGASGRSSRRRTRRSRSPRPWPRDHRRRRRSRAPRSGSCSRPTRRRGPEIRAQYEALGAVVYAQAALEAMPAEVESLHAARRLARRPRCRSCATIRQREDVGRGLPSEHELEDHPAAAGDRRDAASRPLTERAGGVHGRLASRADPRTEHSRQLRDHPSAIPRRPRRLPRVVPIRRVWPRRWVIRSTSRRATRPSRSEGSCAASTSRTCRRARPSTSPPTGRGPRLRHRHPGRLADLRPVGLGAPRRRRPPRDLHRRGSRTLLRRADG